MSPQNPTPTAAYRESSSDTPCIGDNTIRQKSTDPVQYSRYEEDSPTAQEIVDAPPNYCEAVELGNTIEPNQVGTVSPRVAPLINESKEAHETVEVLEDITFPEVPTGPVTVVEAPAADTDYLSMYDLMPLAPTAQPEQLSAVSATGRREVERKAMALSGTGQSYRTQPFNPSTAASIQSQDAPASRSDSSSARPSQNNVPSPINGFSEISLPNTTRTGNQLPDVDNQYSISYGAPTFVDGSDVLPQPRTITEIPDAAAIATLSQPVDPQAYPSLPPTISLQQEGTENPFSVIFPQDVQQDTVHPSCPTDYFLGGALNLAPPPVPVLLNASDADVQRIMVENSPNKGSRLDPHRLEKGKRRALELETHFTISNLFYGREFSASQVTAISKTGHCHAQVLRSSSLWSLGAKTECSVQKGWINAINEAEKFIYIETEFFTGGGMGGLDIKNEVVQALSDKLIDKVKSGIEFRVILILPFTGIGNCVESEATKTALQRQYMTICRGNNSLLYQFVQRLPGVDPSKYISFFSLRNWGVMNNKVVTEQLSIRSNLLIVDDRVMILGSAGISDRCLLGDRNSEVGNLFA